MGEDDLGSRDCVGWEGLRRRKCDAKACHREALCVCVCVCACAHVCKLKRERGKDYKYKERVSGEEKGGRRQLERKE